MGFCNRFLLYSHNTFKKQFTVRLNLVYFNIRKSMSSSHLLVDKKTELYQL